MKECEGDGSQRKSEAVERECRTSGGQTDMTDHRWNYRFEGKEKQFVFNSLFSRKPVQSVKDGSIYLLPQQCDFSDGEALWAQGKQTNLSSVSPRLSCLFKSCSWTLTCDLANPLRPPPPPQINETLQWHTPRRSVCMLTDPGWIRLQLAFLFKNNLVTFGLHPHPRHPLHVS